MFVYPPTRTQSRHPPEPPLDALLLVGAAPERHVHPGEDLEQLAGDKRHREDDQDVRDVLLLLRIRDQSDQARAGFFTLYRVTHHVVP